MSRTICLLCSVVGIVVIASLAGCGKSGPTVDPELVAKYRSQLTLADEPDGANLVSEVRATLLGKTETEEEHTAEESHAEESEAEHKEHAGHDDHAGHDHAHEAAKATDAMDVVLTGQVGGLANPWLETQPDFPFAKNKAVFFLADSQTVVASKADGHNHASGEECSFCEAHAEDRSDMLAMVRFVDEKGKVLQMDVRELFDVKATDRVVVRGSARIVEGGMMVVDATGLHLRR
ncbi:MAG: hypothetical protein GXP26_15770 [Planctomycetes bacterium]|nr:hypothetical protein [Planctomycetota bacterium]